MRRLALLAVLLSAPAMAAQNSFSSQLSAMSELARTTMFNQYMNTAGKTCGGVQRAWFQGSRTSGVDLWNVQCAEKTAWTVELAANGKTTIRDCAVSAARGERCFAPLAKAGARK